MHLFRGCETMIEIQLLIHTPWSILPTPKTDGFLSNQHDRLEETPCLHRGLLWILREGHPFRPWCPHFHPKIPWDWFQLSLRLLHLFWFTFKLKLRSFDHLKILERWDQANKRKAFTIGASFTNSAQPRLVAVCNDLRQVGHAVSQCYSGQAEVDTPKATKTWPF